MSITFLVVVLKRGRDSSQKKRGVLIYEDKNIAMRDARAKSGSELHSSRD